MSTTKRTIIVATGLAVLLVIGARVVLAQGGIEYGWMPACVTISGSPAKNIGQIRAVEPGDGCEDNEVEIVVALMNHNHDDLYYTKEALNTSGGGGQVHWDNLLGVPAGLEDGDDDTLGVLGFYTVENGPFTLALNEEKREVSLCADGDQVTGGGFRDPGSFDAGVVIRESYPHLGPPEGWSVRILNQSQQTQQFYVYAICADMAP